ncbi:hypothetical protein CPC16_010334 [Podila verticillata]|nr:hypothetical protein BGZ59_006530 [Podila verticillata]KAF9394768.1 hypothetical protein CPC16_010334 [Podila verticillata]KFH63933.1 hypothetical protein MVEG_09758 [Podila verticillata NRRL 6337]
MKIRNLSEAEIIGSTATAAVARSPTSWNNRDLEPASSTSTSECQPEQYRFSRQKSNEISGPYAATLQAQMDHMEKLRTEQEKTNVTHNADGLPIPPPVEQRRPSVTQILDLGKVPLSR